jgi:hypothetical protein
MSDNLGAKLQSDVSHRSVIYEHTILARKNDISTFPPISLPSPQQIRGKHCSIRTETQHVHGGDLTVFPGLS